MTSIKQRREDEYYMRMALSLALNGGPAVSPNPRVGCVIVRDSAVIGRGWHRCCGEPHAEVEAVKDAGGDVRGARVYVNLEPCCHYGRTPPCAPMLAEKGIASAVIGMTDPNPDVDCRGEMILRESGVEVISGVLEKEARWINRGFIRRMKNGRPWITVKTAASLDGSISLRDGTSKWITSKASREKTHALRAASDAVITGVGTVIADDPLLTVRDADGETPRRVVLDRNLRTPLDAAIFKGGNVIFFAGKEAPEAKVHAIKKRGAEVVRIEADKEDELRFVVTKLSQIGVNYLMVESGPRLTSSFLSSGLADEISLFAAPKLLGDGMRFTEFLRTQTLDRALSVRDPEVSLCGGDIWIRGVLSCSPDL